jgi:hypothetical protein
LENRPAQGLQFSTNWFTLNYNFHLYPQSNSPKQGHENGTTCFYTW